MRDVAKNINGTEICSHHHGAIGGESVVILGPRRTLCNLDKRIGGEVVADIHDYVWRPVFNQVGAMSLALEGGTNRLFGESNER